MAGKSRMSREKTHQEWAEFERNEQLALADFFAGENVQRFASSRNPVFDWLL